MLHSSSYLKYGTQLPVLTMEAQKYSVLQFQEFQGHIWSIVRTRHTEVHMHSQSLKKVKPKTTCKKNVSFIKSNESEGLGSINVMNKCHHGN